jgi:hypothetical protein
MRLNSEQGWVAVAILLFLFAISIPFFLAQPMDPEQQFGGFLVSPIDGHSYLAKMQQGYDGSWLFTLPFTALPGEGTAINLYYLFLGQVARTFNLSLIAAFHGARLIGAMLLAVALWRLVSEIMPTPNQRLAAFVLALFGSGLGWLAFALGMFTGDFWVAEAFPFLASFTNAHFPIGMALQVFLLTPAPSSISRLVLFAFIAALLSVIYPFGWATTVVVLVGWVAGVASNKRGRADAVARAAAVLIGGLPYAGYALFITNSHPMLSQWNGQNQTPALSPLDMLVSLSPALLLAIATLFSFRHQATSIRLLSIWLVLGVAVLYIPINLQRRLISGLYIPAAGLAVWLIAKISKIEWRRFAYLGLLAFSLPTNLFIVFGGLQAVRTGQDALVVSRAELAAYAWLEQHAEGDLVLAAPETGLRLPAYSSVRVVYGHPFETVNADERKREVLSFFEGTSMDLLDDADFVFYGPRESVLGEIALPEGWVIAHSADGVEIWARP